LPFNPHQHHHHRQQLLDQEEESAWKKLFFNLPVEIICTLGGILKSFNDLANFLHQESLKFSTNLSSSNKYLKNKFRGGKNPPF